jgi:fusion and transport protein UGO1
MSSSYDGPNPLRPYYKPPTIDNFPIFASNDSNGHGSSRPSSMSFSRNDRTSSLPSSRSFSDSFNDYLPGSESSGVGAIIQAFLNEAMMRYTATAIAQPFEVAKTVLQARVVPLGEAKYEVRSREPEFEPEEAAYGEYMGEGADDDVRNLQQMASDFTMG